MVLFGFLEDMYYQHHLLLVEAIYLLLQNTIESVDVEQSEKLLQHYCFMFAPLYGNGYSIVYFTIIILFRLQVATVAPLAVATCLRYSLRLP